MRLGWPLTELFRAEADDVERSRVDCGTCPVSIQCALSEGGNGWRFDCCGAAAVEVHGALLLILDCQRNAFPQREQALDAVACPLCEGDLVKGHVLEMTDHHRYVPTIHARHPPRVRLALFREMMPIALALRARIGERLKG